MTTAMSSEWDDKDTTCKHLAFTAQYNISQS